MYYNDDLTIYEIKIIEILIRKKAIILTSGDIFIWPMSGMIKIADDNNDDWQDYIKISYKLVSSLYRKGLIYRTRRGIVIQIQ